MGSGKGCGLVRVGGWATVNDEVKPTITSRAGWGCRPGWGPQGRAGVARRVVPLHSLAGGLSILILNPRLWPLAPMGRGATFFLLSPLRTFAGLALAVLHATSPKSALTPLRILLFRDI